MNFEKIIDLFMFREGTDKDSDSNTPVVTTGSIVWGVILRSGVIIFLSLLLLQKFEFRYYWWISLFAMWFLVAYPAHRQHSKFAQRMDNFEEETLCGSCRHFIKGSQLCGIYDEHVSRNHIPCGGEAWEPKL